MSWIKNHRKFKKDTTFEKICSFRISLNIHKKMCLKLVLTLMRISRKSHACLGQKFTYISLSMSICWVVEFTTREYDIFRWDFVKHYMVYSDEIFLNTRRYQLCRYFLAVAPSIRILALPCQTFRWWMWYSDVQLRIIKNLFM